MGGFNSQTIEPTGKVEIINDEYAYHVFDKNGEFKAVLFKPVNDKQLDLIANMICNTDKNTV